MAPAQKLLRAGCLLFAAAQAEVSDVETLVQTAVQSSTMLENQAATFKLMAHGLSLMRSHPHKHHKEGESEASPTPAKSKKSKKQAVVQLAAETTPPGCSTEDAKALGYHVKALIDEYKPKFEAAKKENDTQTVSELVEDIIPVQCNMKAMVKGTTVKWDRVEACMTTFSNVSSSCAQCPIRFMQSVVGKSPVEMPFACAMKCGPIAMASFKCGEATEGCDEDMLPKMVPCLNCLNSKLVKMTQCAGMEHAQELPAKLQSIMNAVQTGEDAVVELAQSESAQGREELQEVAQSGTSLQRVMSLTFSALMD